jgi:hypothetical protein
MSIFCCFSLCTLAKCLSYRRNMLTLLKLLGCQKWTYNETNTSWTVIRRSDPRLLETCFEWRTSLSLLMRLSVRPFVAVSDALAHDERSWRVWLRGLSRVSVSLPGRVRKEQRTSSRGQPRVQRAAEHSVVRIGQTGPSHGKGESGRDFRSSGSAHQSGPQIGKQRIQLRFREFQDQHSKFTSLAGGSINPQNWDHLWNRINQIWSDDRQFSLFEGMWQTFSQSHLVN